MGETALKKKAKKEENPETKMLKEKKKKSHDEYVSQAAMFEKQRINFSFSTLDTKSKDIRSNILRMVKGGLSENGALAALTTNPASLLGISAMAGTVEQGKIANIFITDKPYFEEKSKIQMFEKHEKMKSLSILNNSEKLKKSIFLKNLKKSQNKKMKKIKTLQIILKNWKTEMLENFEKFEKNI